MEDATAAPDLDAVAALGEPTRRALYAHVARAGTWVTRDEAADALGIERGTAAHHLDRLAQDGLLETDYQRVSGRRGPGAGRPAKRYRRASRDIEVALPPRDYQLAGRLLAEAIDRARTEGIDVTVALDDVARAEGSRLGLRMTAAARRRRGRGARQAVVLEMLEHQGFEPMTGDDGTVVLRNCPFHRLAQEHRELICGMNLCFLRSAVEGVEGSGLDATLEPEEGLCCVKLHIR